MKGAKLPVFIVIVGNVVGAIPNILVGKNIELNYINKVFGNRDMRAGWSFSKNSKWIFKGDTLNIPAHDTLKYEILY